MARKSSRSRDRGKRDAGKGALGIGLLILSGLIVGGGTLAYVTTETRPALDKETLCPADGPQSVTVILLDSSDPLPEVTRREVRTSLMDAAETVPEYGLLEIRVLDPSSSGGRTIYSRCNPGDGRKMDEYTGNPERAKRRWREGFVKPLERALEGGLVPSDANRSPLLSTLQGIAVDRFSGNRAASMSKNLIVVSDFVEHGPGYSQYGGSLSYDQFRRTGVYRRIRTDLNRAEVTLLYVQRVLRKPINSGEHIRFWTDWVKDNNGSLKEAIKLQGAG